MYLDVYLLRYSYRLPMRIVEMNDTTLNTILQPGACCPSTHDFILSLSHQQLLVSVGRWLLLLRMSLRFLVPNPRL